MRDALISREAAYAAAEGDAGRLYEVTKVGLSDSKAFLCLLFYLQMMLFTFAGSTHTKYVTYLLEFITNIELESSPELRHAILQSTLVNLTGRPGTFCPLDLLQEHLNRMLESVVQRKGVSYGDDWIRKVISRNLHHFGRIKKDLREGVNLAERRGTHHAPHTRPEVQILLNEYQNQELHLRCIGRRVGETDHSDSIDDFRQGILNLGKGKLSTWIKETVSSRLMLRNQRPPNLTTQASDLLPDGEDATTGEAEYPTDTAAQPAIGNMFVIDGELVIDTDIHGFDLDIDSTNNMDE